jgi:hypothetical protein
MRTKEQCKEIIKALGIEFNVSPRLISERLLNDFDKLDMMNEVLTIEALRCFISAWINAGMPDYVNAPMSQGTKSDSPKRPRLNYRAPFSFYSSSVP